MASIEAAATTEAAAKAAAAARGCGASAAFHETGVAHLREVLPRDSFMTKKDFCEFDFDVQDLAKKSRDDSPEELEFRMTYKPKSKGNLGKENLQKTYKN